MIKYLERTRAYYGAQGYKPYTWAHFAEVPFTKPARPLRESRVVLMTTAAPYKPDLGDQGPGAPYNAAAKFFEVFTAAIEPIPDLRISHIGYDRKHCAADDVRTWLPVASLLELSASDVIGGVADQLVGIPTNRSQRMTLEQDAPQALTAVQDSGSDAALLVPT